MYGVCVKYLQSQEDSKDATIEIFEKLLEDLKKHEVENFKGWLYSVAKNHCLMKFRKDKSRVENRPDLQQDIATLMEWNAEMHLDNGEIREQELVKLEEAIKQLKDGQRICIELFFLQEKSYQQIMAETGYDFMQVKSFIQNGKRNLKLQLSGQHERKV